MHAFKTTTKTPFLRANTSKIAAAPNPPQQMVYSASRVIACATGATKILEPDRQITDPKSISYASITQPTLKRRFGKINPKIK